MCNCFFRNRCLIETCSWPEWDSLKRLLGGASYKPYFCSIFLLLLFLELMPCTCKSYRNKRFAKVGFTWSTKQTGIYFSLRPMLILRRGGQNNTSLMSSTVVLLSEKNLAPFWKHLTVFDTFFNGISPHVALIFTS